MDRFTLLPSVNWNISHMLVINEAGTMCAYGSRGDIIIVDNVNQDNLNEMSSKFIPRAHKNHRVMALIFVKHEIAGRAMESLVSCGDDGYIKVWDPSTLATTHKFIMKKVNPIVKFIDLDYFPSNSCIVCAAEQKTIVKWDLLKNKVNLFNIEPKVLMTCIAACPHESDLVAVGARTGLILIYSLKADGKLRHKIRCHDNDVFSVCWCPVPYNALSLAKLQEDESFDESEFKEKDKTLLLGSCSKDRSIYICKAGTNGYCEAVLTLPAKSVLPNSSGGNSNNRYTPHHHTNFERGRYLKWINPLVLITFTDYNEMVFARICPRTEQKPSGRQLLTNVKVEVKPLHNVHQRSISNFAVLSTNVEELNFRVWSCSADRLIVRSGYKDHHKEKPLVIPLLSGFIFSLDISPTTFDRLAIGTGDGKICLWDLSTENTIDITTLSKKIDSKVMSLKWHPYEEGILAFGTYEGRVGIFDVSMGSKTSSSLFKVYHHKPIYKLCWAPPMDVNPADSNAKGRFNGDLYLFAVGNGDIVQFNPNDINGMPVSLNNEIVNAIEEKCGCKFKTDMCFERDRNIFAIGLSNGDVCIFSTTSYALQYVIKEQPKSIMALAWHPKITLDTPSEKSPFCSWLATAGENVFVYDVNAEGNASPKKVASLELHTSRVLDIAWSPHTNGRLLSCSADATVIVWDVISQTVIGRYVQHCAQVLCGVWSFTNKDIAITGSSDFTCRMWSVSKDTVATVKEVKKINEKPIEPTVVNAQASTNENGETSTSAASNIKTKTETCLPSVSHDIHTCPMLENVVEEVLSKRTLNSTQVSDTTCLNMNGSSISMSDSFTRAEEHLVNNDQSLNEESFDNSSLMTEQESSQRRISSDLDSSKKRKHRKSLDLENNYSQLFRTKNELASLISHEERLLETGGSNNLYVLVQARHGLKEKITEAMAKNQVTEHMLALATSVSPKLWKDACQVYVEQLIQADQIMQATNFLLALNKEEEAINLLCDKNRFKEALAVARLRYDDEVMCQNVLEKWIYFCYTCGLYRLGAHCYLYLNEEVKAATLLSKSKIFKDMILAARLLKNYQPERAVELAADGFKRHLPFSSLEDIQDLLSSFPEIKFTKAWYLSYKYLMKETPNTADVTKWLIGMLGDEDSVVLKSMEDVDFEKLQKVIVDNTFNMTFDELNIYVSAQIALYLSGLSKGSLEHVAIRHYIRGLFYCYNYRMVNSRRTQSDSAYPMLKLLRLMFPKGVVNISSKKREEESALNSLFKSINAYFCDFTITWLIGCEELPKSLKVLDRDDVDSNCADAVLMNANCDQLSQTNLSSRFAIIKDKKMKLEKVNEILSQFLEDILDADAVHYLQHTVRVKQFDSGSVASVTDEKWKNQLLGESISVDPKLKTSLEQTTHEKLSSTMVKILREKIEKFEKDRVAAPNAFIFYCKVRDYLDSNKLVDPPLINKMENMLTEAAKKCEILKD